ncbi:dirigent protein 19 [Phtheirospermum japonicum]|uniref:Dirigent protein n=1 Tax=Phtheirospermum japonicum TaxID=374723 RepID=A0A830D716_9LAMI|nr:dirigent protein 19 [Phtheirospermum japonicum]
MIDDPLTLGPNMSSGIVGRAQGIYASADLKNLGLLMAINFVFTEGKFNGKHAQRARRNEVFSAVREMPVVGGSGLSGSVHGYARAKTHDINFEAAVVEYNVHVLHY